MVKRNIAQGKLLLCPICENENFLGPISTLFKLFSESGY